MHSDPRLFGNHINLKLTMLYKGQKITSFCNCFGDKAIKFLATDIRYFVLYFKALISEMFQNTPVDITYIKMASLNLNLKRILLRVKTLALLCA